VFVVVVKFGRRVIVFSGPDGSGKTTLLSMLIRYLEARGVCAGYHWVRGTHLIASISARFLGLFNVFRGGDNPYYGISVPVSLRGLWVHLEVWSFLFYYLFRRFLAWFYGVLVCDRGLLDFIVWVVSTLRYPGFLKSIYGGFLLRLLGSEPVVFVYASLGDLVRRADLPGYFISRQLPLYLVLRKYSDTLCIVDTTGSSPMDSFRELLECLLKRG